MKTKTLVLSLLMSVALVACAHEATRKELNQKVAAASQIQTRNDLSHEATELIKSAKGINEHQRAQLLDLQNKIRSENRDLWLRSLKLRSVLVIDVLANNYNSKEVGLIKQQIKDLESQRVTTLFNAVDKANQILGRDTEENQRILESLVLFKERSSP